MTSTINASTSSGIVSSADTSGVLALQSNGTTALTVGPGYAVSTTNTINTPGVSLGFKNRIINGDMTIDQRNAGSAWGTSINGYTVDRWVCQTSVTGKVNGGQNYGSVTPPAGFTNYIGIQSQSAYSVVSSDFFRFFQAIEGYNVADLGYGTANAKTATLSFYVYSSLTGTFGGSVYASDGTRSYPFAYTISSANTWQYVTITVPGDTSGSSWSKTNGAGLCIGLAFGAGSTYSGTAGSWASANYVSATGATSVVGTNGATFYITGVQLEVGTAATSFEFRDYGRELIMCQRYFSSGFEIGTAPANNVGNSIYTTFSAYNSDTGWIPWISFPVQMRSSPTVTLYRADAGATNGQWASYDGGYTSFTSNSPSATTVGFMISGTRSGGFASYRSYPCRGNYTASAEL